MENQLIETFITEQSLILIPVIYILGMFLKSTVIIPDRYIPLLLLCIAIIFSLMMHGRGIDALVQGILTAGVAVFANQLLKQLKDK